MHAKPLSRFIHISDTHLMPTGRRPDFEDIPPELAIYAEQVLSVPYTTLEAAAALVQQVNALPFMPDFILHTGDVTGNPQSVEDYTLAQAALSGLKAPVYFVPGNHDALPLFQAVLRGEAQDQPYDHQREINGVQWFFLDSNDPQDTHGGLLSAEQLNTLRAWLTADDPRPVMVALHHQAQPCGIPWLDELALANGDALHALLRDSGRQVLGVFCGHIHRVTATVLEGIPYFSAPATCYQFTETAEGYAALDTLLHPGFNVVTVTDAGVQVVTERFAVQPKGVNA